MRSTFIRAGLLTIAVLIYGNAAQAQTVQTCQTIDDYVPVGNEYEVRTDPGYVNAENVNIRSGPGTRFNVIDQAAIGSYIDVVGQAFDTNCDTWVRVRFPITEDFGWLHTNYVQLTFGRGWWD